MSIIARAKGMGLAVLGIAVVLGMMALGVGILFGAAAFSVWVLEWTFPAFAITLLVSFVLLLLISLPPARGLSAIGFAIASMAFGAILWLWSMAYTYSVWGMAAVLLGVFLGGVGVVPIALLAALVHGDWGNLGLFLLTVLLTLGCRGVSSWLAEKADERAARLSGAEITVRAYRAPESATD